MGPIANKQYPPHLSFSDGTVAAVFGKIGQLQKERQAGGDPVEFCTKLSALLSAMYVTDPANAGRINWGRCELPNELNFMTYWMGTLMPSILSLQLADECSKVTADVLTIHGRKDRNAAYGGGREWALLLPGSRLVTIDEGAHAPWIESPGKVFGAIRTFFNGSWPEDAVTVTVLDPSARLSDSV
jgi:pimeloyl-ACP methyl ester carboxylesterase